MAEIRLTKNSDMRPVDDEQEVTERCLQADDEEDEEVKFNCSGETLGDNLTETFASPDSESNSLSSLQNEEEDDYDDYDNEESDRSDEVDDDDEDSESDVSKELPTFAQDYTRATKCRQDLIRPIPIFISSNSACDKDDDLSSLQSFEAPETTPSLGFLSASDESFDGDECLYGDVNAHEVLIDMDGVNAQLLSAFEDDPVDRCSTLKRDAGCTLDLADVSSKRIKLDCLASTIACPLKQCDIPVMCNSTLFSTFVRPRAVSDTSSHFEEEELDRYLGEELKGFDDENGKETTPVPLLTPPASPLTVEVDGRVATFCEWPSNLVVDSALTAAIESKPFKPIALKEFEDESEQDNY